MKPNVVDCSFRMPGDKAAAPVRDVPCGFDPDRGAVSEQPEASPEPARKPAAPAETRRK